VRKVGKGIGQFSFHETQVNLKDRQVSAVDPINQVAQTVKNGTHPDRSRLKSCLEWSLPLDTASWLRGGSLTYLAMPFFLDSMRAFLPTVFLTIVLVIRTGLEDRPLQVNWKAPVRMRGEWAIVCCREYGERTGRVESGFLTIRALVPLAALRECFPESR